jgi:hypothetical protein
MLSCVVAAWITVLSTWYPSIKFVFYLEEHKKERYKQLFTMRAFGDNVYFGNSFRGLKYIYSDLDDDDPVVLDFKNKVKKRLRLAKNILFIALALFIMLISYTIFLSRYFV